MMQLAKLETAKQLVKSSVTMAAGGLVWRIVDNELKIALVKQTNDGLWHLPKGKLDTIDKSLKRTAMREVNEETGCKVKILGFADSISYKANKNKKIVLFWHMKLKKADVFEIEKDIVECRWFSVKKAIKKLAYEKERALLSAQAAKI